MPRRSDEDELDDDDESGDDDLSDGAEDPDESDMDEDDGPETVPCPYCGKGVSEDAEVCPHCGSFMSIEDAPRPRKPTWFIVAVVLCLLVVLLWVL